jgi:hypothetical protein
VGTAVVSLAAPFRGTLTVLDGPVVALDRVVLASGFFFAGSGSSKTSVAGSTPTAARRVVRAVARDFWGGFAGVTGPSDRSLRREGSDGRGSAGAFRLGGIVSQEVAVRGCGDAVR